MAKQTKGSGPVINTAASLAIGAAPQEGNAPPVAETPPNLETLSKEELIALLTASQTSETLAKSELDRVRATTDAAALLTSNVVEVFAFEREDLVEVSDGQFEMVKHKYWYYTLDLPVSAGEGLKINGMPVYHNQRLCLQDDSLRMVKDMVARAWYHERSITGNANDNAFRQGYEHAGTRLNHTLSGKPWASARA